MKNLYVCEKCGKAFDNYGEASKCEGSHLELNFTPINSSYWDKRDLDDEVEEEAKLKEAFSSYEQMDSTIKDYTYEAGEEIPSTILAYANRFKYDAEYNIVGVDVEVVQYKRVASTTELKRFSKIITKIKNIGYSKNK